MNFSAGDQIGDYRVEKVIGEGGMAVVVRARHQLYQHRVAIKVMRAEAARSKETVQRFQREQRTLARLYSGHTVRYYGAGEYRSLPYMILELLRGHDLDETLKRGGPLPARTAVTYLLQACHSVAEAHAQGIIHRDIKPSNLFLTKRDDGSPCIKVLDFGISKDTAAHTVDEPSLTRARDVMGSPWYMSPEQMLASKDVDAAADIWALGVTLYQLLTMNIPFAAETTDAVCQRILNDEPTPLRRVSGALPDGLEEVVMRCLKRRPQERWPSVANLAGALAPFGPEHTSDALSRIYEFLPPTHPQHVVPDDSADDEQVSGAPPGQTEAEETLYLRKAEARGGISGWWSAALAMATFGLGAGLGWVMTLDTDPTAPGGVRPYPAAVVPPKPQPADPQPSKIQPGEDQPALDSAANAAAHNSIDLDDEPAVAPPVAAPPAALAPAPTIAAVPTPVQPMPKPAVAPAPAQPPPAQPPPAQPPPAQAPPPPAAPPPPPPQAPDARDVEF